VRRCAHGGYSLLTLTHSGGFFCIRFPLFGRVFQGRSFFRLAFPLPPRPSASRPVLGAFIFPSLIDDQLGSHPASYFRRPRLQVTNPLTIIVCSFLSQFRSETPLLHRFNGDFRPPPGPVPPSCSWQTSYHSLVHNQRMGDNPSANGVFLR